MSILGHHLLRVQFVKLQRLIKNSNIIILIITVLLSLYSSYIRIVYSDSPGNGKSLFIQRKGETLIQLSEVKEPILSIPIHGPVIGYDVILKKLCKLNSTDPKIIHFDIATSVSIIILNCNFYFCVFLDD